MGLIGPVQEMTTSHSSSSSSSSSSSYFVASHHHRLSISTYQMLLRSDIFEALGCSGWSPRTEASVGPEATPRL